MKTIALLAALALASCSAPASWDGTPTPLDALEIPEVHGPAHGTFGPFGASVPYRPELP